LAEKRIGRRIAKHKICFSGDPAIVFFPDDTQASESRCGIGLPLTVAAEAIEHARTTGCDRSCNCTPFVSDYNNEVKDEDFEEEVEQGEVAAA
jgi:hypothetical protein